MRVHFGHKKARTGTPGAQFKSNAKLSKKSQHMLDVMTDDTADVMTACANLSRSSQDKIACTLKKFCDL